MTERGLRCHFASQSSQQVRPAAVFVGGHHWSIKLVAVFFLNGWGIIYGQTMPDPFLSIMISWCPLNGLQGDYNPIRCPFSNQQQGNENSNNPWMILQSVVFREVWSQCCGLRVMDFWRRTFETLMKLWWSFYEAWMKLGFVSSFICSKALSFVQRWRNTAAAWSQDTRICSVASGERSYHIFFQLLKAFDVVHGTWSLVAWLDLVSMDIINFK